MPPTDKAKSLFKQAKKLFDEGDFAEAKVIFLQVVELLPKNKQVKDYLNKIDSESSPKKKKRGISVCKKKKIPTQKPTPKSNDFALTIDPSPSDIDIPDALKNLPIAQSMVMSIDPDNLVPSSEKTDDEYNQMDERISGDPYGEAEYLAEGGLGIIEKIKDLLIGYN